MREEYDGRRRYPGGRASARIGLACFEPKGAFYVFPDIRSTGMDSDELLRATFLDGRSRWPSFPAAPSAPAARASVRACYAASMKDLVRAALERHGATSCNREKQAAEREF